MNNRKEILDIHKQQLRLDIAAIRLAIEHRAVKGSEAENAFKRLLAKHLPRRYKLGSGFIVNGNDISNQHDIIIYDDFLNAPMYLGDNSGSFLGGSVYGVLETTIGSFDGEKLEEDIKKLAHLRKMFPYCKVAFQKVTSRPILDKEEELKRYVGHCLSSGYSIDDVWPEIKEKCISKEGAFIGNVFQLKSIGDFDKGTVSDIVERYMKFSQKTIVHEEIIHSSPPPRTYICALDGSSYGSIATLAKKLKSLTIQYGAHIHGLLVLNKDGHDWLISTKAHQNYEVDLITKDVLFRFMENMKQAFQGMLVGKYPAADI